MKAFDQENSWRLHFEIPQFATEPQAVISRGEKLLDRMHQVADEIEEQVRRALQILANPPLHPSPNPSDPSRG